MASTAATLLYDRPEELGDLLVRAARLPDAEYHAMAAAAVADGRRLDWDRHVDTVVDVYEALRHRAGTPLSVLSSAVCSADPACSPATRRRRESGSSSAATALFVGAVACTAAGLSPDLPIALALLAVAAVSPLPGLGYALVVLAAPLGLWLFGFEAYVGRVFGGRDYILSLSSAVVVFVLLGRHPGPAPAGSSPVIAAGAVGCLARRGLDVCRLRPPRSRRRPWSGPAPVLPVALLG